jgi:carbamoyl-phosphate synthase large subunit
MKSTGEVMGVGVTFAEAFSKAALGASVQLPSGGRAFLSVKDTDKPGLVALGRDLADIGFSLVATRGTANVLREAGIECAKVYKVGQGRPHVGDMLKNEQIDLIVNTTEGHSSIRDSAIIRRLALQYKVCYTTTLTGGAAFAIAIRHDRERALHGHEIEVRCLQEMHAAQ